MYLSSIRRVSYQKFYPHLWTLTLSDPEKCKPAGVSVVMSQRLCSFSRSWGIFLKIWLYNGKDPFSEVSGERLNHAVFWVNGHLIFLIFCKNY